MAELEAMMEWMQCKFGGPPIAYDDLGRVHVGEVGNMPTASASSWPSRVDTWRDLINEIGVKHGVPPAWVAGFMCQESRGNPRACSPCAGWCCSSQNCCAHGLMQMIWSTATTMRRQLTRDPNAGMSADLIFDPRFSVDGGTLYLSQLRSKWRDNIVHVAAAYNAGDVRPFNGVSCRTPGPWNVRENCGYTAGVVRYTNAAIARGYAGVVGQAVGSSKGGIVIAALGAVALGGAVWLLRR